MQTQKFILSIFAIIIFFILATATSKEDDFLPIQLNLSAEILDTNLILTNNDTTNIVNALMYLYQPTGDSTNNIPNTKIFSKENYDLAMGVSDTIPLIDFKMGAELYPVDTLPIYFLLQTNGSNYEIAF